MLMNERDYFLKANPEIYQMMQKQKKDGKVSKEEKEKHITKVVNITMFIIFQK